MHEEKVVAGLAEACSTIAIVVCIVLIPSIYKTINEVHEEVIDGVQVFRVEMDKA
ncbi:Putative cuticle collagen [Toxocara canis]|uniref:Putative cuticle collagen n=1 Tax=Toxocara canis TaxID=6265 RepID=A0A0B2VVT7_TOXCA|nr:Putative cuticle collagen [Toxocara canis]